MSKTILQSVNFNVGPEDLYALYVDSKKHSAATGASAKISSKVGGRCEAYDGTLFGTTLGTIRNRVFVQSWRGADWTADQADSLLILVFEKRGTDGRLTMVHTNIPDEHYPGIKSGWTTYYWKPWKRYLARAKKEKTKHSR